MSINKLNFRLIRASQYLSLFNIELRYKANKSNIVFDILSRLSQALARSYPLNRFKEALNALCDNIEYLLKPLIANKIISLYYIILIEMLDDFK